MKIHHNIGNTWYNRYQCTICWCLIFSGIWVTTTYFDFRTVCSVLFGDCLPCKQSEQFCHPVTILTINIFFILFASYISVQQHFFLVHVVNKPDSAVGTAPDSKSDFPTFSMSPGIWLNINWRAVYLWLGQCAKYGLFVTHIWLKWRRSLSLVQYRCFHWNHGRWLGWLTYSVESEEKYSNN